MPVSGRSPTIVTLGLGMLLLAGCQAAGEATVSPMPTIRIAPSPSATPTPTSVATPTLGPDDAGGAYLALGDSVTFGIGAAEPRTQGYPARLVERMRASTLPIDEVRVLAVPGETAAGFLERRIDDVEAVIDELGEGIDLVTIGLGANEILRTRRDPACVDDPTGASCRDVATQAAVEAEAALDAVVVRVSDALAAAGSDAIVLLLAYYNPDVEPGAVATIVGLDGVVGCVTGDPAPGLDDRIACIAERNGVGLVDLHSAFLGREEELTGIGAGDVHPNAAGYEVIAKAIADAIGLAPGGG